MGSVQLFEIWQTGRDEGDVCVTLQPEVGIRRPGSRPPEGRDDLKATGNDDVLAARAFR